MRIPWFAVAGAVMMAAAVAPRHAAAQDLRVGEISIEVFNVFDSAAPRESFPFASTANRLHRRTRPPVVSRELLFRTGDRYDPDLLRETERNLRALGLFRRVEVQALPPDDGVVNIVVRVYDAWSLNVDTSFQREGEFNSYDVRLRERNMAGLGVGLSLGYAVGFERRQFDGSFRDPRLFGSRERVAVSYADRSDGDLKEFSLSRPFYTLSSASGHALGWRAALERYRTYLDGQVAREYNLDAEDGSIGWSWRVSPVRAGSVWRAGAGYRFTSRAYSLIPGGRPDDPLEMPDSYRWGGPSLGVQFLQQRYQKRSDILAPGRDVDFNLGLNVSADLFVSSRYTAPGASSRLVASASIERGWNLPGHGLAVMAARVASETGGPLPGRGDILGTVRGWLPHSGMRVTAILVEGHALLNPDQSVFVYLGGTPGLRGFKENQFAGTRSALVIAEERKYLSWRLGGLVQPGVAAFVELGAIGGGTRQRLAGTVHADVGVGLRLVNIRASAPSVIRLDIAMPIGGAWHSGRALQFVMGFRREL